MQRQSERPVFASNASDNCPATVLQQMEPIRDRVMAEPFDKRLEQARKEAGDLKIELWPNLGGPASETGQRRDTEATLATIERKLLKDCRSR